MPRWLARNKTGDRPDGGDGPYSCRHSINHYIGCSDPPYDFGLWGALIGRLGRHLVDRYGIEEVASKWSFEVWNVSVPFWPYCSMPTYYPWQGGGVHRGFPLLSHSLAAAIRHTTSKDYSSRACTGPRFKEVFLYLGMHGTHTHSWPDKLGIGSRPVDRLAWSCSCLAGTAPRAPPPQ